MAREIVVDANVIVAQLDGTDAFSESARILGQRLRNEGADLILLDILVNEAVSVIYRRSRERHRAPPNLESVLSIVRNWVDQGAIRWIANEAERLASSILDVVRETNGMLNFNDAFLVALQRDELIDDVASFDRGFDNVSGFRRIS